MHFEELVKYQKQKGEKKREKRDVIIYIKCIVFRENYITSNFKTVVEDNMNAVDGAWFNEPVKRDVWLSQPGWRN